MSSYRFAYDNPNLISNVKTRVEGVIERELTSSEIKIVTNFIRNLDTNFLTKIPYSRALTGITNSLAKRFSNHGCGEEVVDTHEILKEIIGVSTETPSIGVSGNLSRKKKDDVAPTNSIVEVSKVFGQSQGYQLQKLINPNALLRTNYVILDTRYRILDNDGTKYFSWNHVNNTSRAQGSINTVGNIRDIVALRVFPFRTPYLPTLDTTYHKVSMLIREFQAQSFVGQENRRFHFMFNPVISGNSIFLDPCDNNDGYYRFGQPITQMDNITIDFGSPLEDVIFDPDRARGYASNYGVNLETEFTTSSPHNLITGDAIYISDFSSLNNLATPVVTNTINRTTGFPAIVMSQYIFKIQLNSISMNPFIEGGGVVTLTNDHIDNLTLNITNLSTGDRIRVTNALAPPYVIDEVFNVKYYEPTTGIIHLDRDYGATIVSVYVFKDYRPPPLTTVDAITTVKPSGGITVTGPVATGGSTFLNDYKVGDFINFINISPSIDDGPHTVTSIQSDYTLTTNRVNPGTITGMTAIKKIKYQNNIFDIYFGSKRMFIPIEITYISSES